MCIRDRLNNAKHTVVKADTNIDVSSQTGKGGTTVIWSDQVTQFDGQINAKGSEKTPVSEKFNEKTKFGESSIDSSKIVTTKIQTEIESKANPPSPLTLKSQSISKSSVDPPPPTVYEKGGGFVEISSKDYLKRANIAGVSLNGGTLLLDPRHVYVRDLSLIHI